MTYFLKQSSESWEEPECQSLAHTSPNLYKARCPYAWVYSAEWEDRESELSSEKSKQTLYILQHKSSVLIRQNLKKNNGCHSGGQADYDPGVG